MANADIPFPIETQKTGDPNLGGVGNLKFFHMIDIYKIAAIFQVFHNGHADIPFLLTLSKPKMQNFPLVQFSEFSIGSVFSITLHLKHLCVDIYAW